MNNLLTVTIEACKDCYFLDIVDTQCMKCYCKLYFRIYDNAPDIYVKDGIWEECPLKKGVCFFA